MVHYVKGSAKHRKEMVLEQSAKHGDEKLLLADVQTMQCVRV
jgi:hypothetical protein